MIYISPSGMLSACGVIEFIAEESVLPIKQKMQKSPANRKNPNPMSERFAINFFLNVRRFRDYCTFFAAPAESGVPAIVADLM